MQQSYLTKLKILLSTVSLVSCASENGVRVPSHLVVESLGFVANACLYAIEGVPHGLDAGYMSVKAENITSPLREIGPNRDATDWLVLASVGPGIDKKCGPLSEVKIELEEGEDSMTAKYDCGNDGKCMFAGSRDKEQ